MKRIIIILLSVVMLSTSVYALSWTSDIKTALRFENNATDDTGNYTWSEYAGGMLYDDEVYAEGAYSAGLFEAGTYGLYKTITDQIKTVQFYLNVTQNQSDRGCLTIGDSHFAWGTFGIQVESGILRIWTGSGFSATTISFSDYGNWYLIQITFDGTNWTIYKDGTQVWQAANSFIPEDEQFDLCQRRNGDNSFYGYMDMFILSTDNYAGVTITEIIGTPTFTPTVTPTITETITPTVTETVTPTVTPTQTPWPDYILNATKQKDPHYQGPRFRWVDKVLNAIRNRER